MEETHYYELFGELCIQYHAEFKSSPSQLATVWLCLVWKDY